MLAGVVVLAVVVKAEGVEAAEASEAAKVVEDTFRQRRMQRQRMLER